MIAAMAPATKAAQSNLIFVTGTDDSEVKRQAKALAVEHAPSDGDEFATETIDGAADTVEDAENALLQVIESLNTLPFFGSKLVWLKSANMFSDSVIGRSERILAITEDLLELIKPGLPDNVTLLISAVNVDKRRRFYGQLKKVVKPLEFDKIDISRDNWEQQITPLVEKAAHEHGFRFSDQALREFVELVGADRHQIASEIEKLDLFRGRTTEISLEDVHRMVPRSRSSIIWQLSTRIIERDTEAAVELAEDLLDQGENPIGLLYAAIIPTVRNLLVVRDLLDRHRLPAENPKAFSGALYRLPEKETAHLPRTKEGKMSTWQLGKVAPFARRFTVDELKEGFEACLKANLALVSTGLDHRVILSSLIIRLTTPKKTRQ